MKKSIAGVSCNVVLDSRVATGGLSKVYFRIKEGRVKRDIHTRIMWPRDYFDKQTQQLLPRHADDPDVTPYNLRLNEFKNVAHKLQLSGYLNDQRVTIDDLLLEFKEIGNGNDFFAFLLKKAQELYNDDVIVFGTYQRHKVALNVLKEFWPGETLPINKIDLDFIQRFDAWAKRKKKKMHNTVCGYHKDIKKYLGVAKRKCLINKNPYDDFKFAYVDGDRQALNRKDLANLYQLLASGDLEHNDQEICRRFLFSCVTGLRISDSSRVHRNMITDGVLQLTPYKGRNQGKILRLPLSQIAISLITGRNGLLFENFSHPYIRERIKVIAKRAGITKRVTYHCSRDTFGTMFVEMNGYIKSLSDLMGHASLKTTSIYLKMSEAHKTKLMNNFDDLFTSN
ncbi:MAG: site-specific integrase [Bacteroidota bacterium]